MLSPSPRLATFALAMLITLLSRLPHNTNVAASDIVVSNNDQCTTIGKNLIKKHASAEQIYVAVSLCEGIVHPMDSGLGGGFQAILYDDVNHRKVAKYLMSREYSPFSREFTRRIS